MFDGPVKKQLYLRFGFEGNANGFIKKSDDHILHICIAVSYTHLDVYKRQVLQRSFHETELITNIF